MKNRPVNGNMFPNKVHIMIRWKSVGREKAHYLLTRDYTSEHHHKEKESSTLWTGQYKDSVSLKMIDVLIFYLSSWSSNSPWRSLCYTECVIVLWSQWSDSDWPAGILQKLKSQSAVFRSSRVQKICSDCTWRPLRPGRSGPLSAIKKGKGLL